MKLSVNAITGLLYLIPAFVVSGAWYILLFMDNPPNVNPIDSLHYALTKPPEFMWFRWFLVLPILNLAFSGLYFSRIPRSRLGAIVLFSSGALLAIASWLTTDQSIAISITVPLIYGFKNVREHVTNSKS